MANFSIVRELASLERDKGSKRLLLALYSASDEGSQSNIGNRYIALSLQSKDGEGEWISDKRGITVRKSEVRDIITALQSADFESKSDGRNLSNKEYAEQFLGDIIT